MQFSLGSRRLSIEAPDFLCDKRRLLLAAIVLALAVSLGAYKILARHAVNRDGHFAPITVTIGSTPAGAAVLVDGKPRGHTPAVLSLPPGDHHVTLRRDGYMDAALPLPLARDAPPVSLDIALWLRTPRVRRLRPPLPGATIVDARFLDDGRLTLVTASPPSGERQAWVVEPGGDTRRTGPPETHAAVAPAPDGRRVAYLARAAAQTSGGPGSGDPRATELWVTERDGEGGERRFALPLGHAAPDERLLDLTWAPDSRYLLLVSQFRLPGGDGTRTRLLWHDTATPLDAAGNGAVRELVTLPSDVAPASWTWRPDGSQVAFLTRVAGRVALCLLGTPLDTHASERPHHDQALFRYLADLDSDAALPRIAPLAWAPVGYPARVVYASPVDTTESGGLFSSNSRGAALFVDDLAGDPADRLASASILAPAWRADGFIATLVTTKRNGPVTTRLVASDGTTVDGAAVSLAGNTPDGVRWDLTLARAIVTSPAAGSSVGAEGCDLWLLHWTAEDR